MPGSSIEGSILHAGLPSETSRRAALRSGALAAVAAVFLQFGLIAGSTRAAELPSFAHSTSSHVDGADAADQRIRPCRRKRPVSRGDLVTYLLPKDNRTVYIKRVVGMPGDRVRMIEGRLHINGAPVALERLEDFEMQDFTASRSASRSIAKPCPAAAAIGFST